MQKTNSNTKANLTKRSKARKNNLKENTEQKENISREEKNKRLFMSLFEELIEKSNA